jgi:GAF domain-containing protein
MSVLPASTLTALLSIRRSAKLLDEVLDDLVRIAQDAMPETAAASITLLRGERPFTAAYVGEIAQIADEMQYERGYGPCVDAGLSNTLLMVPDMRMETRWPDYTTNVITKGVLASLSVPLPVQTDVVGGLNLYSTEPSTWPDLDIALELAGYIAVAIADAVSHQDTANFAADMQAAMASRAVIEQAKGVIMAQNRCDADRAFEILRQASMGRNVKLRQLAASLVDQVAST